MLSEIILIKVTRPQNMRKTFDLLTIIRKLNHPMIKQVIPRPRNISTLWHVSVSLLHKMLLRIKIFSSVLQLRSWHQRYDEVEALETKLNSPKLVLIVEFDDRLAGALVYDNQRFCIIKRVYSWAPGRTQEFTWEMLGSQWQWWYHNYRHVGERIIKTFSLSLCPPKTCTRM